MRISRTIVSLFLILTLFLALGTAVVYAESSSITDWKWSYDWPLQSPLPDHLWLDLGGGQELIFLHFNQSIKDVENPFDPEFLNANLMYIGLGKRGRFFAEEKPANPAYTHFHQYFADSPAAGHGGAPGAEGFWLTHVAVTELERPWGKVEPGVDFNFMPTKAPYNLDERETDYYTEVSATDWKWTKEWPVDPPLPDHLWLDIGGGRALFLHYDRPVEEAGAQLMYIGDAVRGRFTAADQPETPGFVHFHQFKAESPAAGHGGNPGAEGYWLRHIAVRKLEMPWGKVEPGVDFNFMVTSPPELD